ncbi:hypothetical protein H5410_012560 [Solanum commersonii]|uniref:DC1 domain-containing protein n=1 Tax=Solanum commersonii TaxID=4109 RepID=A0A9J6AS27_SOLCO|nr:hypothetical protein H5410_012560 [Solanum commersonii]
MGREKRTCQGKQHFSHPHFLKLIVNPPETLTCNACEQPNITTTFYGCNTCQYFLHENCLNAPRFLDHSSHPSHHLTLLPTPTYSNRSYTCKACGSAGNGCSFSCACCEFDVHMHCAFLPQTVFLPQHHHHELELIFESPFYDDADAGSNVFVCDLCRDNPTRTSKLLGSKPRENPVVIRKTEEVPIKNEKEINQEEEAEEEEEAEAEAEDEEEEEEEAEAEAEDEEEAEEEEEEEAELNYLKSILIDKHQHELELCFGSPYEDKDTLFACDICNIIMDSDESLYYCADCDFGSHLHCASPDADVLPSSHQHPNPKYQIPNVNSSVEMINSVSDARERLIAAQIESQIARRGRQAILDSIDGPSPRRYYY